MHNGKGSRARSDGWCLDFTCGPEEDPGRTDATTAALTAAAAEVLLADRAATTDTVAKYVHLATGDTAAEDRDGQSVDDAARTWFAHIDASTLLVDEVGMCGTATRSTSAPPKPTRTAS
ncbi:MAG: hypothetical protein JWR37_2997 [Mycobacterium sp.]|nr:hypothetical protein [Mycobacterium sp.]